MGTIIAALFGGLVTMWATSEQNAATKSANANMIEYLGLSHPGQLYDVFNDDFWGDEYLMAGDSLY